jgi:DMSO/TMAO reductase YedYZ molybdopterin-dependent catalytic subunit
MNRRLAGAAFNHNRLAPTFTGRDASVPRANGELGLKAPLDIAAWRLRVENSVHGDAFHLSHEELRGMPETSFSTYLYCIEGWSDIGHWKGVRLLDFLMLHPPRTRSGRPPDPLHHPEDLPRYISLTTPDGGYYVGIDMASALHPQTMLCYEMGGKPLTPDHGAPLRLYTPVKYGIKSLKRIGTITYTDDRPRDYWAERGYDWYAGL